MPGLQFITKRPYLLYFAIISAVSLWLLYTGTRWGIGTSPDSIKYISSASAILNTNSINSLGTHFPPLYSIFIAIGSLINENLYTSTRLLQVALYTINTIAIGYILLGLTKKHIYSILGMFLFATSPFVYTLHAYALSEGLFLLFLLSGLFTLNSALNENKIYLFIFSALLISLSSLTRYAGISAIVACGLFVYSSKQNRRWILFIIISSIPLLSWIIRNKIISGNSINRVFDYHPFSINTLSQISETISKWLHLPLAGTTFPVLILMLTLMIYIKKNALYREYGEIATFHRLLMLFSLIYITLIVATISFFDALTPLDFRILSPVFICGILYFSSCLILLDSGDFTQRLVRNITAASLIALIVLQAFSLERYFNEYNAKGIGFSSKKWATSNIVKILSDGKYQKTIYTNAPEPISIYTGLSSTMVPSLIKPSTSKADPTFDRKIQIMEKAMRSGKSIYVHFHNIKWRWYLPSLESIVQNMELTPEYNGEDGIILVYDHI